MAAVAPSRIFLSYRRDDSAGWAGRLVSDLERCWPGAVFFDIQKIDPGEDFVAAVNRELQTCAVVLVLIGPDWATTRSENGVRRLDDADDLLRLEIATALRRPGLRVIPVLVGGAQMPRKQDLPSDLQELAKRNAFDISDTRWDYDVSRLVTSLTKTLGRNQCPSSKRSALVYAIPALALVGVLGIFYSQCVGLEFSIDRPTNKALIPLTDSNSWMIEGRLQEKAFAANNQAEPNIKIEVFKLPDRRSIPQQGQARVSTERGLWRYESARFDGAGLYEVVASLSLGGKKDFDSIEVDCRPKKEAYARFVEAERVDRGAPKFVRSAMSLDELKRALYKLQQEFWAAYRDRQNPQEAEQVLVKTFDLVDPAVLDSPEDTYLQNARAFAFKNYALLMRDRGNDKEFERSLAEAERMFAAVRQQSPRDPIAWNGLGSVAALQCNPELALEYIDRALEIEPDYPEARGDREEVLEMLKTRQCGKSEF